MAPPHAADRRTHLRYTLGFVAGLAVVVLSECIEAQLAAHSFLGARGSDLSGDTSAASQAVMTPFDTPAASASPSAIALGVASSASALAAGNAAGAAARLLARLPTPVEELVPPEAAHEVEAARGRRRPAFSLLPS